MKIVFKVILFIIFLNLNIYAQAIDIKTFKETIGEEEKTFSVGDLNNIDHIKKSIYQMYQLDQEIRQAWLKDQNNKELQELISKMNKLRTQKIKQILQING